MKNIDLPNSISVKYSFKFNDVKKDGDDTLYVFKDINDNTVFILYYVKWNTNFLIMTGNRGAKIGYNSYLFKRYNIDFLVVEI